MFTDLKDKIILITGSSRGIGKATARILSEHGAKVLLNAAKSAQELKETHEEIKNSDYFLFDVGNERSVKESIEKIIAKYGCINGLVNNAGGGGWSSVVEGTDRDWKQCFQVDVLGTVHVCRCVVPHMQKQGKGVIVNVSSLWGVNDAVTPSGASYCAAKAAVIKISEALAKKYAPQIRVNTVAPGFTRTAMLDETDEVFWKMVRESTLLKRAAEPEEIANLIVFLLSDASSYITGQCISIDGAYKLAKFNPED